MTRLILRTSSAAAAALLLAACERAGPPPTSPDAAPAAVVKTRVPAEADLLLQIANRLQAEYTSGVREFPPMAADPRESVSPETMRMMIATGDRLARAHAANAD